MPKVAFLLAALLLPAAAGGQDWRGPASIAVQVEDAKGRNLAGAEILLVYLSPDGGGSLPSVLTDASGKANIGGLAAGRWTAEIRHAGHMSYRAELALSAGAKPDVLSAAHLMAPGATSTMKVKFARGRGGASPVPAAPAVEKAPVREVPPAAVVAPAPAPVAAPPPAAERAPVRGVPPAAVVAPAPAPVVAPVVEKAQVRELPPAVVVPPAPAPAPVAAPAVEKAPVKELSPSAVVAPAPAPVAAPAAPVPAPRVAAPVPVPAPAPGRARLCVECPPGESAAWGEAAIDGGATVGCPADLPARLRTVELSTVAELSSDLGAGCRVIAVELPAGARFTGFRYEAQSAGLAADCLPGRGCPAGGCRFPNEPVLRQEGNRTVLLVAFESTAPDLRRAVVAGYSTYNKR